jgi:hypothetical protein
LLQATAQPFGNVGIGGNNGSRGKCAHAGVEGYEDEIGHFLFLQSVLFWNQRPIRLTFHSGQL